MSSVFTTSPRSAASAFHDLVAGHQRRPDRAADVERQRRHVRPELDLVGRGRAEQVGHGGMRLVDRGVAAAAGEERTVVVRVRRPVVVRDRRDDRVRDLRPAGAVEQRDRPAVLLDREGRKPAPERFDVEGGHRNLVSQDRRSNGGTGSYRRGRPAGDR
jgi:hypothetical protein